MNKLLFMIIALIALVFNACAQTPPPANVPSVVVNAFHQRYPKATDVEWEMDGPLYEVEFEIGFVDYKAWLDSVGNVVKHKQDIKFGDLPVAVQSAIKKDFAAYKIDDIDLWKENGVSTYQVELESKASGDLKVIFDANGVVLQNIPD